MFFFFKNVLQNKKLYNGKHKNNKTLSANTELWNLMERYRKGKEGRLWVKKCMVNCSLVKWEKCIKMNTPPCLVG